ncbi:CRAL/TRIO domain-containing protein [Sistotremastrum niveocremeum HHB9708]|uniref:CRAL/TRIO domain-containing protein n=1 Tax=Sistotremastrum niveocremeum HHB9708 TaxID=1314777 RepID=A0A164TW08_9AGAM|nr:CRAL/TRIO domain-containing protein [Sistotremastrum niveocremeum HHB9708]
MPEFLPLAPPPVPVDAQRPTLSEEEEKKRQQVLEHFDADSYEISGLEKGALLDEEKCWLSNECILRYLRASKWVLATAITRIEETLKWRRSYGFYDFLTPEHVEPESLTGKQVLFGYDTQRRPALLMIPSRQNTTEPKGQLQFAVFMMERAIDLMGPGVETMDLLINFAERAKNPALGVAREMLHIIQSHYPERLGLAIVINIPFLVNAFFKLILPFVDPITRPKIKFNPNVIQEGLLTADNLMTQWWGGEHDFEWDHQKYWPALMKMCYDRRKGQMERWKQLGGRVGISEWDMKQSTSAAVDEETVDETPATDEVAPASTEIAVAA